VLAPLYLREKITERRKCESPLDRLWENVLFYPVTAIVLAMLFFLTFFSCKKDVRIESGSFAFGRSANFCATNFAQFFQIGNRAVYADQMDRETKPPQFLSVAYVAQLTELLNQL